jgi:hypothetical protein
MSDFSPRADPIDPLGDSVEDPAPVSVSLQVMLVLLALGIVILIAGVPGLDPVAGNGSEGLRKGWAESRLAAADQDGEMPSGNSGSVDPADQNR